MARSVLNWLGSVQLPEITLGWMHLRLLWMVAADIGSKSGCGRCRCCGSKMLGEAWWEPMKVKNGLVMTGREHMLIQYAFFYTYIYTHTYTNCGALERCCLVDSPGQPANRIDPQQ